MNAIAAALQTAVDDVIRERFPNIDIVRVDVSEGEDHDGEPAVFVRVVFQGDPGRFDPGALAEVIRHLRSRLREIDETRFPYTRFVAKDELDGVAA